MRIDSVSRPDFPVGRAPQPAAQDVRPDHAAGRSAQSCTTPPPYDVFIASEAVKNEIDRPVYSDVLEARREALRRAAAAASNDQFQPLTFPGMAPQSDATRAHEPRHSTHGTPPTPDRTAARQVAVRRLVDTVDNRGSLIDLLL